MKKKYISKIVTRTGDQGKTSLLDRRRVDKDHLRVEVIGTLDELMSMLGVVKDSQSLTPDHIELLTSIQVKLHDLCGELGVPKSIVITKKDWIELETTINQIDATLTPLHEFIMPGGSLAGSHCHVARTICRRAERQLVTLSKKTEINPDSLIYLNRLSDLLFVLARKLT